MFTVSHDYYGILGVSKNATREEIKVQYRKFIRKHHPDQFKGLRAKYQDKGDEDLLRVIDEKIREADEKCKLINEAFEVLSDPIKRKQYDEQVVEPSIPLPEISIHPTRIAFGSILEGQNKSLTFTIENKGGTPAAVNIDWERDKPDWGELMIEPDAEKVFPIKVTVKVDTTGILSGPKDEKILVDVDGRTHMVEVFLAVTSAVFAPATGARPPTPPTKTRFTAPPAPRSEISTILKWVIAVVFGILCWRLVEANQRSRERSWQLQQQQEQQQQQQEEQQRVDLIAQLNQKLPTLVTINDVRRRRCEDIRGECIYDNVVLVEFTVTNRSVASLSMTWKSPPAHFLTGGNCHGWVNPNQTISCWVEDVTSKRDGNLIVPRGASSKYATQLCIEFLPEVSGYLEKELKRYLVSDRGVNRFTLCVDIPNELSSQ